MGATCNCVSEVIRPDDVIEYDGQNIGKGLNYTHSRNSFQ